MKTPLFDENERCTELGNTLGNEYRKLIIDFIKENSKNYSTVELENIFVCETQLLFAEIRLGWHK